MSKEKPNNRLDDNDIAARCDVALQLYRDGHLQQAQDECLRVLRKQQRPDVILILAKIAHEQRDFKAAVERYQQFLKLVPDHEQTYLHFEWQ